MELKITLSDAAVAAFASLGIDPATDLNGRVSSIVKIYERKREISVIEKLKGLTSEELAPIAVAIDAAIEARPKPEPVPDPTPEPTPQDPAPVAEPVVDSENK